MTPMTDDNAAGNDASSALDEGGPATQSGIPLLPDPGLLWQIFRRNIWLFLGVLSLIIALTAVFLATRTPLYAAQSSLLIEPSSDLIRTNEPNQDRAIVGTDEIDTEIKLIGSTLVADRAADLYAQRFASPDGDPFSADEREMLAARILGSTFVYRTGETRVVDILATSEDPAFAAAAANMVAEAYLNSQVASKTSRSESTANFINARLSELERNALQTQAAVDNYRAARGLAGEGGSTNAEQEVSNLNQQLALARAELAEKRGRYNAARAQLQRGSGGADVGAALGSGTVGSLRQQEANVSARVAVLREKYGELHPERRQAERELNDIRQRIQDEINRVLSNLQADVQTAQSRVSSLESSRGGALGTVQQNSRAQTALNELEQKAAAAQSIYQSFLERSQEEGALRDSAMPDATISARAEVPVAPSSPNYPLIAAAGGVLAFIAAFFAVLVAEYLRRGVQTKRDVERRLHLRYAGAVPSLSSTIMGHKPVEPPHDYVLSHPHSLFAEAFRSIRTFLTLSPGTRPRAIAITSALPGEGKTTTSVCLARTSAAEGGKVLLVDADLRRRGTSVLLDFAHEYDIFDYLEDRAPLDQCVSVDPVSQLHVLGSNEVQQDARNPLTSERIAAMFTEMRDAYDIIIIDTAPILGVAEGRIIATAADRVLLITKWKKTSLRAVEAAANMLLDAKAKITGLALTQVNIKKYASTGEGDVYAYTKKFRGYYQN